MGKEYVCTCSLGKCLIVARGWEELVRLEVGREEVVVEI